MWGKLPASSKNESSSKTSAMPLAFQKKFYEYQIVFELIHTLSHGLAKPTSPLLRNTCPPRVSLKSYESYVGCIRVAGGHFYVFRIFELQKELGSERFTPSPRSARSPTRYFHVCADRKFLKLTITVGNTLQLGPQPQKQLTKWADQYGELMQVQIGWENWVFLNSPQAVKDILDKQSAITSGRAPMPVGSDLISGGMRFLLMDYTPTWRKLRTIVHKLLTPKVSSTFMPSQLFEAKQLVHDLLTDNRNQEDFYMHVRRYTTSVVLTSTYGRRVQKWVSTLIYDIFFRSDQHASNVKM